ncbi:hypothetical protein BGT96224_Ac30790 [Blumeria graminis f. sp. tritici 96224]|nr:hypothetical protein BGT96224_Ac30790 [Blumeria graminis f. sp. tritici 96224]
MADTRPTVAELVEKLHSNIDWISQIVLKLSDDTYNREIERLSLERESAIHSLREERVDALKKLLAERAVEKEETEIRRQREKEVIDEKRAREWEEILMRRKKEDLERIRILEIEDLEKERIRSEHDEERERQREEEERSLFEKCEDEIERLENEAQRKIEEGQAELKKLDEDRKIINQQIEAALSAPTVIPKITLRTRRPKTLDFSRAGTIEDLHKRSHTSLITPKSVTSKRDASSPGNNFEPDTGKFTPLFMNHENLDIYQTEECYRNQGKEEALPGLSAIKVSESMQSHDLQKEIFETNLRETSESEAHANEIFNGQKAEVFSNSFTSQLGNSSKKNDQQFHSNFSTQIFSGEISQNSVLSLSKNLSQNEVYKIETEKESPYECQISSKETSDCFDEKLDTSDISRDLKNLQTHSNTKKYNDNLVFTASKPQNFDTNGCSDEISSIKSSKRESKNEEVGDVDHKKHSSSIDIPECKNDFYISIPSSDKTSSMMPGLVSNPGISTGGNIKLTPASKEKEELNSMVNEIPNNLVAKKEAETLTHAFTEIETKTFSSNISLNSHETSNDFMELSNAFNSLNSIKKSEIISSTDQIPDILKESITFHTSNQKVLDSTTYERNLQTVNSNLDSTCQSFHSTENLGISSSQLFEIRTLKSEKESALKTVPYDNVNSLVLSSQDEGATKFYDLQNSQPSPSFDVHRNLTSDNYYVDSKYQIGENIPLASSYQIQAIKDTKDDMDQTDEKISPPLFNGNASAFTSEIRISSTINKVISQSQDKSWCTNEVVNATEVIQEPEESGIKDTQISDAKTVESSYHEIEQESLDVSRVETSSSIIETIKCSHDEEKVSEQSEEKNECTTEVVYTTEVIQISEEAEIKDTQISDAKTVESSYHEIEQESLDVSRVETSSSTIETIESSHDKEKVSEQSEEKSECTTEVVYTTEVIQISDAKTVESSYHEIEQELLDISRQESLDVSRVETSSSTIETIECSHDEEKVSEQSEEKSECTTEEVFTTEVIQKSDDGYSDVKDCTEEIKGDKNRIHDLRTSHGISLSSIIMECDPIDVRENLTSTNEDNKCMAEIEETLVTGEWKNVISLDDVQILSMKKMIEDLPSASDRISFETEIDKIFTKGAETSKVGMDLRMSPSLRYKRNINRDLNALSGWDKTSIQNSNEISNAQPSSTLTSNLKISPNTEEIHPSIDSEFLSIAGKPKTLIYDEYQLCINTINKRVPGLKRSPNPLVTNDGPLKTDSIDLQNQVENTIDTVKLQNFNEPTLNLNHIHTSFVEAWSRKHHENNLDSELYEDKLPTSSVMEEFFDCYSDNSNYEFNPGQESEKEATNMEYIQSFLAMDEKPNDFITHEQSELSEGYRGDKDAKSKFQQNFDNLESISEVDEICDLSIIEDQTFSRSEENLNKTHQKSSDSSRYCFKADQEIFTDRIEDVQKINHRHESSLSISESIPTYKFSESTSTPTSPSEAPSSPFHENPIDEPIISSTWQGNMTGPGCMEAQDFKEFSTIVSKKSDICESHPISDQASSLENQVYLPDRPSEDNLTETPLTSKNLEQLMMQQKELSESNPDFSNTNKRYPISAQTSKIMIQQRIGNTNFHENSPTSSVNSSNILTKNNIQTKTTSPASSVKSFNLPSSPFQKARALFESQQQNKQQFKQNPTRPLSGFFAHRGVGLPAYSHSPSNLQLANFRSPIMEVNETREINEKIGDPSIVPLPNSPDCGSASALSSHSIHSISHPGTWSPQAQSKAAYRPNTPERSRLLFF